MALIEPPKPYNVAHFIGENFEVALNQSIQSFLDSCKNQSSDFSVSSSAFLDLMLARVNPPLEAIWFYSASTFRSIESPKDELLDRLSVTKDLFQSITACSASCSSSRSIVLIAPVIYEIYRLFVDLKGRGLGSKTEKKLFREIKSLVDVILGYINVCCLSNDGDELESMVRPLGDLVRVWIGDNIPEKEDDKRNLRLFFPLLSNEIVELLSVGVCSVGELAGVVIAEAFLLKLCFKFSDGTSRLELENHLRTWAVGSITGFASLYLFETLVKLLLEPTLPVTSLLNSEDEIFLRKILYDSVILVEYSFLNPERTAQLPPKHVKSLCMAKLMVTHQAIEFHRGNRDQTKAISYTDVFSTSHLPSQLIELVMDEIGIQGKVSGPNGSSPKAFLNWLLNLEDQGMRVLGDDISKYRAKLALDNIKTDEKLGYKEDKRSSDDDFFFIDNKGNEEKDDDDNDDDDGDDDEIKESISAAFLAAARTMQSAETEGRRKRKKGRDSEKKKKVKFIKYDLDEDYGLQAEKCLFLDKDGSSGDDSDVENPASDEDV